MSAENPKKCERFNIANMHIAGPEVQTTCSIGGNAADFWVERKFVCLSVCVCSLCEEHN